MSPCRMSAFPESMKPRKRRRPIAHHVAGQFDARRERARARRQDLREQVAASKPHFEEPVLGVQGEPLDRQGVHLDIGLIQPTGHEEASEPSRRPGQLFRKNLSSHGLDTPLAPLWESPPRPTWEPCRAVPGASPDAASTSRVRDDRTQLWCGGQSRMPPESAELRPPARRTRSVAAPCAA